MKKVLMILLLMFFTVPAFCSDWQEIFTNQEVDFESIEHNNKTRIIKFFVKKYKDNRKDKMAGKDYNYLLYRMALNCPAKKERIELITIYGLYNEVIYSNDIISEWKVIIPDTYTDGYYRLFCLVPFNENPLLKK